MEEPKILGVPGLKSYAQKGIYFANFFDVLSWS